MSRLKQVLVVDDDDGTRVTFSAFFRYIPGVALSIAPTGDAALTALDRGPLDLVLCDLRLPDMSGLDILRHVRQQLVDTPFVMMTAWATSAVAVEAGRLAVTEFLDKPIGIDSLETLADAYLRNGRSESSAVGCAHARRAERMLQQRYREPGLSLQTVADALGISRVHLCRVFKPHVGVTFEARVRAIRLDAACQLMQRPDASLKAIAYRVGFRDPSQFTRAFRSRYGVSPTEYRAGLDVNQRQAM